MGEEVRGIPNVLIDYDIDQWLTVLVYGEVAMKLGIYTYKENQYF